MGPKAKMSKSPKLRKRVRKHPKPKLTLALSALKARVKARPRGKSFESGNGYGSEYRFKPGESGNPGGRPKSAVLSAALRAKLKSDVVKKLTSRTFAEKLCDKLVEEGLDGNVNAIVAIGDRTEGKPAVTMSVNEGADGIKTLIEICHAKYNELEPTEDDDDLPQLTEGLLNEPQTETAGS